MQEPKAASQPPINRKNRLSTGEKLEQRNHELGILKAIAEELNRAVDVKSALENSLGLVGELLGLKTGWVWLLDEGNNEPYLAASRMLPPFLTDRPSRMRGKNCECLRTFLAGDMTGAANVNVLECSRLYGEIDGADGLHYHASIPIYAHDRPLGIMNVASTDWRGLDPDDLQLLYTIGYQVGVAIERARLFDQTLRLATTEERNRLAREIHDTIAQGMAAAILNLESADVLLDDTDPARQAKGRNLLRKALNLTRSNLEEARRSVLDLRAAPLQEKPLAEALAALVEGFGAETGLKVHFELAPGTVSNRRYPARTEAGVYRVAQEALTNIQKHAQAHKVRLALQTELVKGSEDMTLTVEDDGKGFEPAQLAKDQRDSAGNNFPHRGHFGLIGMNERAHLLNGNLSITSCPGGGTNIKLTVSIS